MYLEEIAHDYFSETLLIAYPLKLFTIYKKALLLTLRSRKLQGSYREREKKVRGRNSWSFGFYKECGIGTFGNEQFVIYFSVCEHIRDRISEGKEATI